jgi:TolB-like protein/AraC-like DNA-binding protein/tetratricopeptide (TPR) repeat protein
MMQNPGLLAAQGGDSDIVAANDLAHLMSDIYTSTDPFLRRAIAVIETHLEEEDFGVAELAEELNMSRSTLLRRIKGGAGVSVSIFIRKVRLRQAKELLQDNSLTISEVAFKVGFSSSSYFAKCFREEYGYPPGEEGKQQVAPIPPSPSPVEVAPPTSLNWWAMALLVGLVLIVVVSGLLLWWPSGPESTAASKTIAVLPFQNDSQDSSNVYLINGLMVALIDNLHQINDLQVTSRTTVERYRGVSRTVPELAEELGVSYFVEGSGQKIDDQILLTLRLIDAQADTLIWSRRYQRETTDIFQLQTEVSTSIAQEIEVIITPEEQQRIGLPPTNNLLAYDHYLKGLEQIKTETREGLIAGIASFQQAIAEDEQFAHPHAYLAISYYFLDLFQVEGSHLEDINTYADKALLFNPDLNESLIGKALYYMQAGQYELAIQFFHKVLAKSPDSGWIHNLLSTIYSLHLPDTEQYLRHALQGIRYVEAGQDSAAISAAYMHLSNALSQNGFFEEAEPFLEKSLRYQADNLFAEMLLIYVKMGKVYDLDVAYQRFQTLLARDSTFLPILQEVAKFAYFRGEYEAAWGYYHRLLDIEQAIGINMFPGEDIKIAYVLEQMDRPAEAAQYQESYLAYLQKEESIYRDVGYAMYYASKGEQDQAMASLKAFSQQDGYPFWLVIFIDQDPIMQPLTLDPAYAPTIQRIRDKFWNQHRQMRAVLEAEGGM